MVLFSILAMILFVVVIAAIGTIVIGGSAFIIVFADLIVCAAILYCIIKALGKKKSKKSPKK